MRDKTDISLRKWQGWCEGGVRGGLFGNVKKDDQERRACFSSPPSVAAL